MSLFKNRLSQSKSIPEQWHDLSDINQLETIITESKTKPVMIFKHSTTCGISFRSKTMLEGNWDFTEEDMKFYYLDLLTYRPISNKVAEIFGVRHQSPQVLLIKDGKAVFNTSHHAISAGAIRKALDNN